MEQGAGGEEAREFIAGKQRSIEMRLRWNARVIRVGQDGVEDFFRPAPLAQEADGDEGVLLGGGVPLVVHVMEQAGASVGVGQALRLPVLKAQAFGLDATVGLGAGGHGEGVFAQTVTLCPILEQRLRGGWCVLRVFG